MRIVRDCRASPTAMVTSAPRMSADGSPGLNRFNSVPNVAAATGTPSCAAAKVPNLNA